MLANQDELTAHRPSDPPRLETEDQDAGMESVTSASEPANESATALQADRSAIQHTDSQTDQQIDWHIDAAMSVVDPSAAFHRSVDRDLAEAESPAQAAARRSAYRRIGVFGGTFDPIHLGHLILAQEAWFQLGLDRVYLVPAGDPPHKQDRRLISVEDRLYMAQLATTEIDYVRVSRIDADRPGPHFTADMVRLIRARLDPRVEMYFLMGMDSLRDLPNWSEAAWLIRNCKLVALSRHDVTLDWDLLEAALPGLRERVVILDMPELEISSQNIQYRVRTGQPIRFLVPRVVDDYIQQHGLYAGQDPAA